MDNEQCLGFSLGANSAYPVRFVYEKGGRRL